MGNINSNYLAFVSNKYLDLEQESTHRMTAIYYHNGDKYQGQLQRNLRDGYGIYICADKEKRNNYEYVGNWKNNLREGFGKCYFYNGDLYVGEWKGGKRHGHGEHFYRKGDRYIGEYKSDMKDGKGTLTSANGTKFEGKFKQDKKHGQGEMHFPDGQVFEEVWQFGVLMQHKKKEPLSNNQNKNIKTISSPKKFLQNGGRNSARPNRSHNDLTQQRNGLDLIKKKLNKTSSSEQKVQLLNKIKRMIAKNSDVLEWENKAVLEWLSICKLDKLKPIFQNYNIDGYTLMQIKENELENYLKIESLGQRKNLMKNINILKMIWYQQQGNEDANIQQQFISGVSMQSDSNDQVNNSLSKSFNRLVIDPKKNSSNEGTQLDISNNNDNTLINGAGMKQRMNMSAQQKREQQNLSNYSNNSNEKDNPFKKKQIESFRLNDSQNLQEEKVEQKDDDEYLGQASLIKSFKANGFNFFIDFNELKFDTKTDYIGGGGYGDVYQGKWYGTIVGIKRFGKRYLTKKAAKDFIKEIEVVNQLRHPNIILYMGVTLDPNNHYYMVTEFVNKGSLFEILHQKKYKLDDEKIFKIAQQIALALQYLHKKKILHCDLKSQNILLNEDWSVKICDFGLARYKEKFLKDNHGKIGTPHWMAPEILRGEKYEEAADVYSFGVILWEMLTGEIPFMGRSIAQITGVVGYHKEKLEVPMRCNKHLRKIVNNCLIYESERRPTFEHILQYIDKIERRPRYESSTPLLIKLSDFFFKS